ncbi:PREDICTED: sister chromatid cohesion DCC1 [Prunus dulcis]|uniref:PREDICTED: sister chromatid cohesion DCC1 n=1 Tax=Prunus dulcis TaxID=3755 RepID=A0A5E4F8R0_PRUDU|nr:PREDICTED: sister chromatid cohesion DCC1 [Prunus dulcis]
MPASLDMLEGEVLIQKLGAETGIQAFSVSSLPYNLAKRFSVLFKERPKWEWKDRQPYIRDFRVPGLSAKGLLLKYTKKNTNQLLMQNPFSA